MWMNSFQLTYYHYEDGMMDYSVFNLSLTLG